MVLTTSERTGSLRWPESWPASPPGPPPSRIIVGDVVAEEGGHFGIVMMPETSPSADWSIPIYGFCLQAAGGGVFTSRGRIGTGVAAFSPPEAWVVTVLVPVEPQRSEDRPRDPETDPAVIAREIRSTSGLSAQRLGGLFPVKRETYQRWISGEATPSSGNLERLLAIRHFMRALADRVESPKSWLLAPLHAGVNSPSPYAMLKAGRLGDLWEAIGALPSRAGRRTYLAEEGGFATEVRGSLRGRAYRANDDELDDYAELFDDK
jgi:hypothetical protein